MKKVMFISAVVILAACNGNGGKTTSKPCSDSAKSCSDTTIKVDTIKK